MVHQQESKLMFIINIMYMLFLTAFTFVLQGCGKDTTQVVTQTQTVQLPVAEVNQVALIIQQKNEYRFSQGQAPLTQGLVCTLHNLSATTPSSIPSNPPSAVATFTYIGSFNQIDGPASNELNLLPSALKPLYTSWYMIKCQGQMVVIDSGYQLFNLTNDDGSNLYIDGVLVVNNDGNHNSQLKQGQKLLERGVHTFRLDYMQANGNQSLILEGQSGVLSSNLFYH